MRHGRRLYFIGSSFVRRIFDCRIDVTSLSDPQRRYNSHSLSLPIHPEINHFIDFQKMILREYETSLKTVGRPRNDSRRRGCRTLHLRRSWNVGIKKKSFVRFFILFIFFNCSKSAFAGQVLWNWSWLNNLLYWFNKSGSQVQSFALLNRLYFHGFGSPFL